MGTPGYSELIAGKLILEGVPLITDQEEVTRELTRRLALEMAREIHQKTGLEISSDPQKPPLSRAEYLVCLVPDQENVNRLNAFCEGWSGYQPLGVRAKDLSPMQVQELGRLLRARLPSQPPDAQE